MEEVTFSEIISYAKIAEDNARKFYHDAAARATQANVRELLEALAAQEQRPYFHLGADGYKGNQLFGPGLVEQTSFLLAARGSD